jgi:hypothetical protein
MPRGSLVGYVCPHLQIQDLLVFLYLIITRKLFVSH